MSQKLVCIECHKEYTDQASIDMAKKGMDMWFAMCAKDGEKPKGICPCPAVNCLGELVLVTTMDGTALSLAEATKLDKKFIIFGGKDALAIALSEKMRLHGELYTQVEIEGGLVYELGICVFDRTGIYAVRLP